MVYSFLETMKNRMKKDREEFMRKRLTAVSIFLLCMICLLLLPDQLPVKADEVKYFSGEVSLLKETESSFVFQVDVGNNGEDFEGLVRLRFNGMPANGSCSYEKELSLPAGGQKQYKVSVPVSNVQQSKGSGSLTFVDSRGKKLQTVAFKDLLGGKVSGIRVGILSDDYDSLTYLDMGGESYAMGSISKPVQLVKMEKDQVADTLDGLYFLVIDHFDTSALGKDTVAAIEKWVDDGGCLLLGTGAYAKETLSGFDQNYLDVTVGEISKPGESNPVAVRAANGSGDYFIFKEVGIDFEQMSVASLSQSGTSGYETSDIPGIIYQKNKGCVIAFPFSLGEQEMQKGKQNSGLAMCFYDNCAAAAVNMGAGEAWEWYYQGQKCFAMIDHKNSRVNFTFPKVLMLIYVILIGPLLYLFLRLVKKRESYWICVPVLALVFVGILFVYGQSVKINRTTLYSVSVQEASGSEEETVETYYSGYHSGVKPWSVKLSEGYTFAGAGLVDTDSSGNAGETDRYVINYGEGIRIGMNPASNFETGYLYAAGTKPGKGAIETENLVFDSTNQMIGGSITNNTPYDFPYLYVRGDDGFLAVRDVKAKETIDLAEIRKSKRLAYESTYVDEAFYDFLDIYGNNQTKGDNDLKAALMIGMNVANGSRAAGDILVCGIVPDYEKTISGKCGEVSFGCFYTTAEQEVSDASN